MIGSFSPPPPPKKRGGGRCPRKKQLHWYPQSGWKAMHIEERRHKKKKKKSKCWQWPAMLETATIGGACKPPGPICLWMHVSLKIYEQGPSAPAHSFEILTETDIRLSQLNFVFHFLFSWEATEKNMKFALFSILKWELWESFII